MKVENEKVFATTKQVEAGCDKVFEKYDTVRAVCILETWAASNFELGKLKELTNIEL